MKRLTRGSVEPATTRIRSRRSPRVHGAGVLPGRCINQHNLPAAGLDVRTAIPGDREERQSTSITAPRNMAADDPMPRRACPDFADEVARPLSMRSRRGPECLGVRASSPPVVALVVMDERPAPRCKRRRYRCAVLARPIRRSTVRYQCVYCLRVSLTCGCKTLRGRQLRAQTTCPRELSARKAEAIHRAT